MWPLGLIAAVLAAGALYQRAGLARERRRFPAPGVMVPVGGHRLHVTCAGAGAPPVLLEAGIAATSLSWARVSAGVASFTRVCAYDRAGLGWSEPASSPRTFLRILDELAAIVDHTAPRRKCLLVGHSFGAFVVRAYAARHPDRVAALVLVDPAMEWLASSREHARLLRGGRQMSRLGAALAHVGVVRACLALLTGGAPAAPRRFVKAFGPRTARTLERLVGEVRKLPPDVHPMVQAHWCHPKCFRAMAEYMLTLERDRPLIASFAPPRDIPVTVVSGGDQPPEHLHDHRLLAAASGAGRHVIASRSAHWVQFDEPEVIVEAVRELVTRA